MIDSDDVGHWFGYINPTTLPGLILYLLVGGILIYCCIANEAGCAKMACPEGLRPRLMDSACLCVVQAKEAP